MNYVDLHVHLSAAASTHSMWEIAHQQGIRLEEKDYWKFLESFKVSEDTDTSWDTYHHHYDVAQLIQSSPIAIERSVYEAVGLSYRKSKIDLLEIRFNPMRRNKDGLYDLDRLIFSAIVGMKRASLEYPVKCGLIIEADRRFSAEQNDVLFDKAIKYMKEGIVGVDLSGPEVESFKLDQVVPGFARAREAGLGITIHTGEYFRPYNEREMEEVIEKIRPNRIGHGIKAAKDKALMQKLVDNNIMLEICPTSNINLGNVSSWGEMSEVITAFKNAGVKFNINSDGPVFLDTNVKEEYDKLIELGILTPSEAEKVLQTAREASFITD